ncbi:MAG: hypothetical protein AAB482_02455 [Patescibacteria group bacterium]
MSEGPSKFELDPEDEIQPVFPAGGSEAQPEGEQKAEVIAKIAEEEKVLTANLAEFNEVSEIIEAKLNDSTEQGAESQSKREQIRETYQKIKDRISVAGLTGYASALGLFGGALLVGEHAETLGMLGRFEDMEKWNNVARHLAEGSIAVGAATVAIWAIARGINKYATDKKERETYS